MSIKHEIRAYIVGNFLIGSEGELQDDDSFLEKGIFDSTGILELVSFLENTYGIQLESDELIPENLDSISSLARFLERKLAAMNAVSEVSSTESVARPPA